MSEIVVTHDQGLCTVTINRPDKKNALTAAMYEQMTKALRTADEDTATRVVMITGTGNAFTSGNDLLDFMNNPPTGEDSSVIQFLLALTEMKKPLVAAVNGTAVGIGVTMLLHCDVVYCASEAKFTAPFAALGLCPEGGSSMLLPQMAGHAKACEVLMFGEPFDAAFAVDIGLCTRAMPATELLAYATSRCRVLCDRPPSSLRSTKRLLREHARENIRQVILAEATLFAQHLGGDEAREAFGAFFERRKPDFSAFH
jgi:enoyl-CoA hydratase/carnithine racemase